MSSTKSDNVKCLPKKAERKFLTEKELAIVREEIKRKQKAAMVTFITILPRHLLITDYRLFSSAITSTIQYNHAYCCSGVNSVEFGSYSFNDTFQNFMLRNLRNCFCNWRMRVF